MADMVSLGAELVFIMVAFTGAYYAVGTYRAFRHDVMEGVFRSLSGALLLVGGVATVLLVGNLAGSPDSAVDLLSAATLVSFAMILVGLVPVFKWARGSREGKSGP